MSEPTPMQRLHDLMVDTIYAVTPFLGLDPDTDLTLFVERWLQGSEPTPIFDALVGELGHPNAEFSWHQAGRLWSWGWPSGDVFTTDDMDPAWTAVFDSHLTTR